MFGVQELLSLTRAAYALLSSIWQLLLRVASHLEAQAAPSSESTRHRFEPLLLAGLRPGTVKSYQKEVGAFLMWLDAHACQPELPEEYDDILCAYLFNSQTGLYRISRSRAEHLLGGVEKVLPRLKGKVVYARHLLKEWAKAQPSRHTAPMPWIASLTLGNWRGLQGCPGWRTAGVAVSHWRAAR